MAPKILLTGATGYVGGTILHHLLACSDQNVQQAAITVLVRGEERAQKLSKLFGDRINCTLFTDWDETHFMSVLIISLDTLRLFFRQLK